MLKPSLTIYGYLSRLQKPRSYQFKLLLVAFLGVHVPLLVIIAYLLFAGALYEKMSLGIIVVIFLATLLSSAATVLLQYQLLTPIWYAAQALRRYTTARELPQLPTHFQDDAGILMANTQTTLTTLDDLLRMKTDLLQTLSHDMRSPLQTIMILSEMIELKLPSVSTSPNPQAQINKMQQQANRIAEIAANQAELINNILLFAQADASKFETTRSKIQVDELLAKVQVMTEPLAAQKQINYQICYETSDTATMIVAVDVPKTVQILNNLVTNAIKFVKTKGRVTLTTRVDSQGITFLVKDNGIGIPAELQPHLFTSFSAAHRQGLEQEIGTGLGLWICKMFSEIQGGTISVQSEVDKGSCFSVWLPL